MLKRLTSLFVAVVMACACSVAVFATSAEEPVYDYELADRVGKVVHFDKEEEVMVALHSSPYSLMSDQHWSLGNTAVNPGKVIAFLDNDTEDKFFPIPQGTTILFAFDVAEEDVPDLEVGLKLSSGIFISYDSVYQSGKLLMSLKIQKKTYAQPFISNNGSKIVSVSNVFFEFQDNI